MALSKKRSLYDLFDLKGLAIAALILLGAAAFALVSLRRANLNNVMDRKHISDLVASTPGLESTNISEIEFTAPNRARVYTLGMDRNGGDLLTVEKRVDRWTLVRRGAWMN